MDTLLAIITPIALFDMAMVLPAHSVILLTQLGANRPIARASLYVTGFFVASFGAGVLVAVGLEQLIDLIDRILFDVILNPSPIDYVLQFGVALALLYIGYRLYRNMRVKPGEEINVLSSQSKVPSRFQGWGLLGSFLLGFVLSLAGTPSALTYFAAIDQMIKADIDIPGVAFAIAYYNVIVVAPFLIFIVMAAFTPTRSRRMLEQASQIARLWSQRLIFVLVTVLAIVLLIDSIGFFLGRPVIPVLQATADAT